MDTKFGEFLGGKNHRNGNHKVLPKLEVHLNTVAFELAHIKTFIIQSENRVYNKVTHSCSIA